MLETNDVSVKEPKVKQEKKEILALWAHIDRKGTIYYKGNLPDGTCVLAFYNPNKGNGSPDLRVFKTNRKTSKSA